MEILLDQKTMLPLLIGAALALVGGIVTQLIFWRTTLAHTKNALLTAFRAELKIIRENLGSALDGYRISMRADDPPTPTAFSIATPVFGANAGHLGQLRDLDLVEHIVEAYSGIQALSDKAALYQGIPNRQLSLRDLNAMHLDATIAHVQVIKLHNRLANVAVNGSINKSETEVESREKLEEYASFLNNGQIEVILERKWVDA